MHFTPSVFNLLLKMLAHMQLTCAAVSALVLDALDVLSTLIRSKKLLRCLSVCTSVHMWMYNTPCC